MRTFIGLSYGGLHISVPCPSCGSQCPKNQCISGTLMSFPGTKRPGTRSGGVTAGGRSRTTGGVGVSAAAVMHHVGPRAAAWGIQDEDGGRGDK